MSPVEELGTFSDDNRSANPKFGMGILGNCKPEGVRPALDVEATSDALPSAFDLSSIEVRDLLDARFGRHLDDELSHRQPADCQGAELIVHKLFRVRQHCNCPSGIDHQPARNC